MSMRIFRISNIFSWSVVVLLGTLLFWASQSVQQAEEDLSRLNRMVNLELEAIRVLEVEWDYLNSPTRLEELADTHLQVDAVSSVQLVDEVSDIPEPAIAPIIPSMKPIPVSTSSPKKQAAPSRASLSKPVPSPKKSEVIQNSDRRNFDALLQELTEEGGY